MGWKMAGISVEEREEECFFEDAVHLMEDALCCLG